MKSAWVLLSIILLATPSGLSAAVAPDKDQDWSRIVESHKKAYDLLAKEELESDSIRKTSLRTDRMRAFAQAAALAIDYRRAWIPDKQSVAYLKMTFRVGLYAELSQDYDVAKDLFKECTLHSKIESPESTFNGPIKPQAVERLIRRHS